MITYKNFRPSHFDSHINFDEDREDWLVGPCVHNRDSDILTEANWKAFNQAMWEARSVNLDENDYEVHRFGHWGNGWFEIVLIKPGTKAAENAKKLEDKLENYPILDEDLHSSMEDEATYEYWKTMSLRERIEVCKKRQVSIFAARKDDCIPDNIYDYLRDRL